MLIRSIAHAPLRALVGCVFLFSAGPAFALGLTVNSTGDTVDANPGDGTCGSALPNTCTLRAAIMEANANGAADNVITFSVAGPTNVLTALPNITKSLTVSGGTAGYTINGGGLASLLRFTGGSAGSYALSNLRLTGGTTAATQGGGAVYFSQVGVATLTLTGVTLDANEATAGPGGGLAAELLVNGSGLIMSGVTISSNTATGSGGGIWVRDGASTPSTMSLDDSTVTGNTAGSGGNGSGGGINVRRGRLNIGHSTISDNASTGTGQGAGINLEREDATNGGSVRIDNSTISGNTGDGIAVGATNAALSWMTFTTITGNTTGIRAAAPSTNFPGTALNPFTGNIVAGNTTNCTAAFAHSDATNSGYNLTNGASCGFTQATDKVVATAADAKLGSLADNPAAPQTHALTAGSPAIDAGNAAWSTGVDQRGADAQDGGADGTPGDSAAQRDIGAYEYGGYGLVQFGLANFDVDEDSGPALVLIRRYGTGTAATTTPAVRYGTSAGTATEGACGTGGNVDNDYTAVAGPITANPMSFAFTATGATQFTQTASMTICNNVGETAEPVTETFNIALQDPSGGDTVGYDFGPNQNGTVTIHDSENGTFQFNPLAYAAAEGNPGADGSATLTITRTGGTHGAVRVNYASSSTCTTACTATAGTDYTAVNTFIDFADGEASKTITINFIGDSAYENNVNETFEVTLSGVSCPSLAAGQSCDARLNTTAANRTARVAINNDDTATAGTLRLEFTAYTANETGGTLAVKVKRVGGSDGAIGVTYGSTDGTAISGVTEDYFLDPVNPHTLSWTNGDTADKTITINLVNDPSTVESNKDFVLSLLSPTGGATIDPAFDDATVTLISDEQPAFQFSDTTVATAEGSTATVQLSWTAFEGGPVQIGYHTQDGTAVSPADYTGVPQGTPNVLTVNAVDATTRNINVATATDAAAEGNETFNVVLNAPTGGATLGAGNPAVVTITDPAGVRFTSSSFTRANEQNGQAITVNVERIGDTSLPLSVDFAISQNCLAAPCATEGTDYTRSGGFSGTLSWAGTNANATESSTKSFAITVIGDTVIEGDEGIKVTLSNAVTPGVGAAAIGGTNPASAVIPDDDYRFEIVEASPLVVAEGAGTATVTVRRFGSTVGAASVSYATANGTAIQPGDYTTAAGTLNWTAGVGGTQTASVTIADDALDEADESFAVSLSSPSNNASGEATSVTGSPLTVQITDDDTAAVTVAQSGGSTAVTEGGATDDYTIVLTSQPTADVTVTVSGDADATGSPTPLTFTSANWNVAQTVTVTAVNDAIAEGGHSATLSHAVTSGDASYNGAAAANVVATITDDDAAAVTVTQSGGSTAVTEGGATDDYTIVLTSQPTADVTVTVSGDADATGSPTPLTFTSANWNVAQTVTVTAVNDAIAEGGHSATLSHAVTSGDASYNGAAAANVVATITDDDAAAVTVTESGGSTAITEAGATDTYTIVLGSQPTADVTVTVSGDADATGSPTPLTFTSANWNVAQTVTVSAVNDSIAEGAHTGTLTHTVASSDAVYDALGTASVVASITDNDSAAVTVTPSGGTTAVTEGGATDTYTLVLTSQPSATVTITITAGTQVTTNPTSVIFTTANWNVARIVTVTAVNDVSAEGTHATSVTHAASSTDSAYGAMPVASLAVTITDNDVPGITVVESNGSTAVTEGGATDTVTVRLNTQPSANVTITAAPGSQLSATPATLTFTPANFATPQTVTVGAVDDAQIEGQHSGSLGGSVSSTDAAYNGSLSPLTVAITDNDAATAGEEAPAVVVTYNGGSVNVVPASEGGGGALGWPALAGLLAAFSLRRRRALLPALVLAALPGASIAQGLSYDSAELRYLLISVDDPSVDATGFAVAGSASVSKDVFVTASYATVETDEFRIFGTTGSSATDSISVGIGAHRAIEPKLDLVGGISVVSANAEGQGGFSGSADDIGFGVELGFRGLATPALEWASALSHVAIFDDGATGLSVQFLYHVGPRFGLAAGGSLGDDSSHVNVGVRYSFARAGARKKS